MYVVLSNEIPQDILHLPFGRLKIEIKNILLSKSQSDSLWQTKMCGNSSQRNYQAKRQTSCRRGSDSVKENITKEKVIIKYQNV